MSQTSPDSGALYKRHLRGWLAYSFAYEVFAVVSLTLFLPICLEQFARDNGFFAPSKTEPCSTGGGIGEPNDRNSKSHCVVKIGWLWIDTASFSLYVYSISVALQALTVISIGGLADKAYQRKILLLSFAAVGSISTILVLPLPSTSPVWLLVALFAIVANVCFGASVVTNNAYLPGLARESFEVVEARRAMIEEAGSIGSVEEIVTDITNSQETSPLLAGEHANSSPPVSAKQVYENALSLSTARLSSLGIGMGYTAGIILLCLMLIPVIHYEGSTFSLRFAIGCSGIWWASFTIPAGFWLPAGSKEDASVPWDLKKDVAASWRKLARMLRWSEIKRLGYTFVYLSAWFLLSDGFTTITSTAVLFAKTTIHLPIKYLLGVGIITPAAGIIGSLVVPLIQRRLRLSNRAVIVILVVAVSAIPLYGCLGFIPVFAKGKVRIGSLVFGGLNTPGEMLVLALYFGSLYGAFQGYARAFYAELIPPGEEARWFALFSITDKSSAFIGPLVVGLIADATGNIRYAFFFLVGMVWSAVPLLLVINVEKGKEAAKSYSGHS